jgi:hypothetical protein
MLEALDKRNGAHHQHTSAALEAEVTSAAAAFSERVATASSVAGIEIAHAEVLGSPAVQAARALVDDVDAFRLLTEAAWRGLERFHEICGTAHHATTRPLGYPGDFAILVEFARMSLGTVAPTHSVRTVVGNAIKDGELVDEVGSGGPFDVIYSFGFFDYFTDEQILRTVQNFLPLLADGGQVIFCLKDQRYLVPRGLPWRPVARTNTKRANASVPSCRPAVEP